MGRFSLRGNTLMKTKWVCVDELDVSFQHCGRPAYWEGNNVYCSKCQEMLGDDANYED